MSTLERKFKGDDLVLAAKDKWPNDNPTYCKFVVKVKRGAPEEVQMKYRDAIYN